MTKVRPTTRKVVIIGVVTAGLMLYFLTDLRHLFTIQSLKQHRVELLELSHQHPVEAVVVFVAAYVIVSALAIPVETILSLAAGAVFGVVAGTVYTVVGATIGATAGYLLAGHVTRDFFERRYGRRAEKLQAELKRKGLSYLLFLRLVPIFPFVVVTVGAAFVGLPLRTFVTGTFIGTIPASILYNNAGASLATISSTKDILSPRLLISLLLLGGLAFLPALKSLAQVLRREGSD